MLLLLNVPAFKYFKTKKALLVDMELPPSPALSHDFEPASPMRVGFASEHAAEDAPSEVSGNVSDGDWSDGSLDWNGADAPCSDDFSSGSRDDFPMDPLDNGTIDSMHDGAMDPIYNDLELMYACSPPPALPDAATTRKRKRSRPVQDEFKTTESALNGIAPSCAVCLEAYRRVFNETFRQAYIRDMYIARQNMATISLRVLQQMPVYPNVDCLYVLLRLGTVNWNEVVRFDVMHSAVHLQMHTFPHALENAFMTMSLHGKTEQMKHSFRTFVRIVSPSPVRTKLLPFLARLRTKFQCLARC